MGKNRTIKIIGGIIGVMVAHKILLKFTNKPESLNYLMSEVSNYRNNIQDWIREYNWNAEDKKRIKDEAMKCLKEIIKILFYRYSLDCAAFFWNLCLENSNECNQPTIKVLNNHSP